MPSRKLLERKSGSLELTEAIRVICSALEKKIRNLEKRKGKLETYKSEISEGKPLNEDQKIAVIKCDEVGLTLTFTNQLLKQLNQAADDVAKIVKRQVKYRNLERLQRDTVKAREILIVQDVLSGLGDETAREDFLAGKNGALKLTAESLENLDKLYKLVTPCRDVSDSDPSFEDQLTTASTHLAALVNSRDKDILGTTYKQLMDLILEIHNNDYFKVHFAREIQEPVCTSTINDSCVPIAEPIAAAASPPVIEPHDAPPVDYKTNVVPSVEPVVVPSVPDPPPIRTQPTAPRPTYPHPQAEGRTVFTTFNQSKSCKEIIDDSPCSFNFLLDSQIELDASHIDPAVVAVHSKLPPSAVISYAGSQRPDIVHFLQPSIDESIGKMTASAMNPSIHPKANQFLQPSQVTQHVPAANFSQTIPSQTFMNQTFVNLQTFTAALYGQLQQQPKQPQLGEVHHHHQHQQQQLASTSIPVSAVDVIQEPKKHLMNVNATTFESLSFKQPSPVQLQPVQPAASVSGMQLMEEMKNISIEASNKQRTANSPQFSDSPAEDNVENESDRYKESNQYGSYEGRSNYNNSNNGNGRGLSRGGRPSRAYSNGYMGRGGRSSNNNYTNGGRNYHNNYRDYYQNSYSRDNYEGTSSNSNYNNSNHYRRREGGSSAGGNGSIRANPRGGLNGRGGGANGGSNRGNFRSGFTKSSEPSP